MSHHREAINASGGPAAAGPYSHAVRAGGLVFLSGQVALDPASNELVGASAAEQARQALENLAVVAAAAGASLSNDAVKLTVYLAEIGDGPEVNAVYAEFFPSDPPARAMFAVAALPLGARVEIEAVLAVSD